MPTRMHVKTEMTNLYSSSVNFVSRSLTLRLFFFFFLTIVCCFRYANRATRLKFRIETCHIKANLPYKSKAWEGKYIASIINALSEGWQCRALGTEMWMWKKKGKKGIKTPSCQPTRHEAKWEGEKSVVSLTSSRLHLLIKGHDDKDFWATEQVD